MTEAIERAWNDLPPQIKAHPGIKALYRAALAAPAASEPVAWQWRRKDQPWSLERTFNSQVYATTADSEVRALYAGAAPAAPSVPRHFDCVGREFDAP